MRSKRYCCRRPTAEAALVWTLWLLVEEEEHRTVSLGWHGGTGGFGPLPRRTERSDGEERFPTTPNSRELSARNGRVKNTLVHVSRWSSSSAQLFGSLACQSLRRLEYGNARRGTDGEANHPRPPTKILRLSRDAGGKVWKVSSVVSTLRLPRPT